MASFAPISAAPAAATGTQEAVPVAQVYLGGAGRRMPSMVPVRGVFRRRWRRYRLSYRGLTSLPAPVVTAGAHAAAASRGVLTLAGNVDAAAGGRGAAGGVAIGVLSLSHPMRSEGGATGRAAPLTVSQMKTLVLAAQAQTQQMLQQVTAMQAQISATASSLQNLMAQISALVEN